MRERERPADRQKTDRERNIWGYGGGERVLGQKERSRATG